MNRSSLVEESAIANPRLPVQSNTNSAPVGVGDFLVRFGTPEPAGGRVETKPWNRLFSAGAWQIHFQPPAAGWNGWPLTELRWENGRAWLIGELYPPAAKTAGAELVRDVVAGIRSASQLNGHFVLLAWQEDKNHWHIWTNRFGTVHFYHASHGDATAFGTSFRSVAQVVSRRQLDWIGLTGFFGFGFFPGDRTFFDNIRLLKPATHYVFEADGKQIRAERYWHWFHQPEPGRRYDDTVAEFADLFGRIMADLTSSRVALPLSGGLDSRCTAAALSSGQCPRATNRLWAYSYGYSDHSVETSIARQIAAARNLAFTPFTIKSYLFAGMNRILAATEGFHDITQCRQAFVAEELGRHADHVVCAHWGDVWCDTTGVAKTQNAKNGKSRTDHAAEFILHKMAKRGRGWLLENVCARHLGGESPEDVLRQFVADGMNPLQHIEDEDFRVKAFKTDHWSFRWTLAGLRMFQAAAFPRLPFYDTRFGDFFCTVPTEFVAGRRLQIDYLKRFAPDLARVEWQVTGHHLFDLNKRDLLAAPRRAARKLRRLFSGQTVPERNWEVQFGDRQARENLEFHLSRPGRRLHAFVAPAKVHSLITDFYNRWPDSQLGFTVSMLLTFSAWLEQQ